jgi:1-deoxy-D-xylulose-5-phosphate reductoisomerase
MYALSYPDRLNINTERLDFNKISTMNFKSVDINRYPAIRLAYEAGRKEGTMPTVFNAANEVAVDAFINKKLRFLLIEDVIEKTLLAHNNTSNPSLEEVLKADKWAREYASKLIESGEIN